MAHVKASSMSEDQADALALASAFQAATVSFLQLRLNRLPFFGGVTRRSVGRHGNG